MYTENRLRGNCGIFSWGRWGGMVIHNETRFVVKNYLAQNIEIKSHFGQFSSPFLPVFLTFIIFPFPFFKLGEFAHKNLGDNPPFKQPPPQNTPFKEGLTGLCLWPGFNNIINRSYYTGIGSKYKYLGVKAGP